MVLNRNLNHFLLDFKLFCVTIHLKMAELFSYSKIRYEYDKWPLNFKDTDIRLIEPEIKVETNKKDFPYIRRDPNFITLSTLTEMSDHTVRYLLL